MKKQSSTIDERISEKGSQSEESGNQVESEIRRKNNASFSSAEVSDNDTYLERNRALTVIDNEFELPQTEEEKQFDQQEQKELD